MPKRNLLAFAIAVAVPLACNRKDGASGDSAAAVAKAEADTGGTADSQPSAAAAADDSVPVDVTITLSGGQAKDDGTYRASGKASRCEHVIGGRGGYPEWTIIHGGGGIGATAADVELKVGNTPAGTSDQLSAMVSVGLPNGLVSPHFINTFAGTVASGSGTAKVVPQDAGARFDLSGVDNEGTKISATVICKKLSA